MNEKEWRVRQKERICTFVLRHRCRRIPFASIDVAALSLRLYSQATEIITNAFNSFETCSISGFGMSQSMTANYTRCMPVVCFIIVSSCTNRWDLWTCFSPFSSLQITRAFVVFNCLSFHLSLLRFTSFILCIFGWQQRYNENGRELMSVDRRRRRRIDKKYRMRTANTLAETWVQRQMETSSTSVAVDVT